MKFSHEAPFVDSPTKKLMSSGMRGRAVWQIFMEFQRKHVSPYQGI